VRQPRISECLPRSAPAATRALLPCFWSAQVDSVAATVTSLVQQGYMVRVRSDVDTMEARANDTYRAERLIAAGAHFVSTDFPLPPTQFASSYQVSLPGGRGARCNPVTAGAGCSLPVV
jgi:Phosphoinositide phospholipase C, Ca2+-dependent